MSFLRLSWLITLSACVDVSGTYLRPVLQWFIPPIS